jgi:hypothetical protein
MTNWKSAATVGVLLGALGFAIYPIVIVPVLDKRSPTESPPVPRSGVQRKSMWKEMDKQ